MEGYTDIRYYTNVYEGTPLTISTLSYIVYWPFPPIILVAAVFWVLYIVLRKFIPGPLTGVFVATNR